jgi:cyclic beta-1,2-glucan synthetase
VPGIRENGGQYTHAALWAVRGLAAAGRRERAARLLERLTPVHHTRSAAATAIYQVEPYLVAADLYGVPPHVGSGGWTGYTG